MSVVPLYRCISLTLVLIVVRKGRSFFTSLSHITSSNIQVIWNTIDMEQEERSKVSVDTKGLRTGAWEELYWLLRFLVLLMYLSDSSFDIDNKRSEFCTSLYHVTSGNTQVIWNMVYQNGKKGQNIVYTRKYWGLGNGRNWINCLDFWSEGLSFVPSWWVWQKWRRWLYPEDCCCWQMRRLNILPPSWCGVDIENRLRW